MDESSPAGFRERLRLNLAPLVPLRRYLLLTTETHAFCAALAFFVLLACFEAFVLLGGAYIAAGRRVVTGPGPEPALR